VAIATSDRQLLEQFLKAPDSGAFRSLVVRHGPTVLQMCRRVLQDAHEAEDAFQATFMVLVRKARSIEDPDSLGGWLRGVAYRTALRARCRSARRHAIERSRAEMAHFEHTPDDLSHDLRNVIRAELERLPDSYREPVTLCYLEGMTHQEAARKLGWPVGTVKVRLVRGRRLLRERLDRRGVCLGSGLLFLLLDSAKAHAAVPAPLVQSTTRAMTLAAKGRRAALPSEFAAALDLADATLRPARLLRFKWAVVAVVGTAVVLGLSGPAVRAFRAPLSNGIDRASLPANLTDILNVYCE
jgi:RNA polymerase sigma factor (sigma-70 family)